MVSKSKALGKPPLIFVTIGTTNFQFDRLFAALDRAIASMPAKPTLFVQSGRSKLKLHNTTLKNYLYMKPKKMIDIIEKADKIIIHGGFGSMYLVSKHTQVMPLIVARSSKFQEHVDNHQVRFLEYVKKKMPDKCIKYFCTNDNLGIQIKKYLEEKKTRNVLNKYLFDANSKREMAAKVKKYLSKL